jgi:hypothetical protein
MEQRIQPHIDLSSRCGITPGEALALAHLAVQVGQWNGNKVERYQLLVITDSVKVLQAVQELDAVAPGTWDLGTCYSARQSTPERRYWRGIHLRPGRNNEETRETLVHELAHAYVAPTDESHGGTFRMLNALLMTATTYTVRREWIETVARRYTKQWGGRSQWVRRHNSGYWTLANTDREDRGQYNFRIGREVDRTAVRCQQLLTVLEGRL